MEEWKLIKGFELYSISNFGRVKNNKTSRILKQNKHQSTKNYYRMQVGLFRNGKCNTKKIHRLVAETFIPTVAEKPHINHIDNDTSNNNVNNLEWCNQQENNLQCKINRSKFSLTIEQELLLINDYYNKKTIKELKNKYKITQPTIHNILKRHNLKPNKRKERN